MLSSSLDGVLGTTKVYLRKLESIGVVTVRDFLFNFPRTYQDSSSFTKISELKLGEVNTVEAMVKSVFAVRTKTGKKMVQAVFTDDSGVVGAVWFNQGHITKMLFKGMRVVLTGKVKMSFNRVCFQAPTFEVIKRGVERIHSGRIVPVYAENEGISTKWFREKSKKLIDLFVGDVEEVLPGWVLKEYGLVSLSKALGGIHFPGSEKELEAARYRLGFQELLEVHLNALRRKRQREEDSRGIGVKFVNDCEEVGRFVGSLEFSLTGAQERVLDEILTDMQRDVVMSRLVQGDVGSGKTVVAMISALRVVKSSFQVAVMAPTEILASQHYVSFVKMLTPFGVNVQFLAGSSGKAHKEEVKRQLSVGTADVVVGTHALIQDDVSFEKLALVVIDEQHRFGVKQRDRLKEKGVGVHLLSMTATPIPRTLAITLYGDQDISVIDEMPAGRKKVVTRVVPEQKRKDAYLWIKEQILKGRQAYIICPLIEDGGEGSDLKSVVEEYERLNGGEFSEVKMAYLHGRMTQEQKGEIMAAFKRNEVSVLISTSVIEVGINVPNATIMLIEGAERFGLSQLHQFRGRVGRGDKQSYCFLFTSNLTFGKNERLSALERYSDGFKLSEIDLELRGPGEVYGVRQSGLPDLKLASLSDYEFVSKVKGCAEKLLKEGFTL